MTTYDKMIDLIYKRMGDLNMSNKKLAKIVSVDYHSMNRYLSGITRMPADVLFASLQAVGCRLEVKV